MQFLECKYAESIEERCCVHRDAYSGIIEVLFRVTGPNFRLYQKDNLENLFFKRQAVWFLNSNWSFEGYSEEIRAK